MVTIRHGHAPNWGKNCDFRPISGFDIDDCWTVECHQHFDGGVKFIALSGDLCLSRETDDEAPRISESCFMTVSFDVTAKTTEQNLIVRIGESEAEVTNNKKDCARVIVLLKLTIDRREASIGLSATAELLVLR